MDQQVIDTYVDIAVNRIKRHLQECAKDKVQTPSLALILGTVDPVGSALEQPVIFAISAACFPRLPSPEEYIELIREAAAASEAVALVVGLDYMNSIMVEVRGRHDLYRPTDTTTDPWKWSVEEDPTARHLLPGNVAN